MCLKIAFLTHIKFLNESYRDNTYEQLRILIKALIDELNMSKQNGGRLEITQTILACKYYNIITKIIFNLNQITENHNDITSQIIKRSHEGFHSSLIQLNCFSSDLYVFIFLQSLPPFAVLVSNATENYIKEYGKNNIFVMDINKDEIWVGTEN